MNDVPRVHRNDWSRIPVPDLSSWRPTLTVSVVIPAYASQEKLDLTLASLSRQTYPGDLLDVVVVDDGSEPALRLPHARPERTRIIRPKTGWGRANALHTGAAESTGQILHWLDSDMLVFPDHVAAQARWHHAVPYAVTLGYKRFVEQPAWPSPEAVVKAWEKGAAGDLFAGREGEPHDYVEEYIARTDQLRAADHLAFMIHVGATAALRRELYEAAGGFDPLLRLGEDTEFGYRLAQAGALFVPEPGARSWHLGASHVMRQVDDVRRYNRPFLADRMPYPRWLRKTGGAGAVPLVEVVTEVGDEPFERVRAAVDAVLRADEQDVRVTLVGPWDKLHDDRVKVLADPLLDLRLTAEAYRTDPRVRLVTEAPTDAFPAAYLLELPITHGLSRQALRRMVDLADREQVGVVRVEVAGRATVLWRTAARSRARWVDGDAEKAATETAVTEMYGRRDVDPAVVGVVDLGAFPPAQLAAGIGDLGDPGLRPGQWVPASVEVAGIRSLGRATVVVAALMGRRLATRLKGMRGRRT